jgi:hypothetical protein
MFTLMRYLLLALSLAMIAAPLAAQTARAAGDPWNSERAIDLIRRAQQQRSAAAVDTGLVNFQADARLFVYFYLDRPGAEERNLVKTDQLALEVFWQAPDEVKQRIVGWRDEKSLPTNINYHLDHLTVVMENFGDEILLGDGDEVSGVPHPAAPGAEAFYDYRLADSLTLGLPGAPEPVRVYELRVRPKDPSQPAIVGSVFVERRAGDIVRMDFTFTRSAYVDRYLDYINIALDNGLWGGRFWLPNQQQVEIRRRIPQFEVPVGSVIRATMRVGNYRFNQSLPLHTFLGPTVTALPREQREAFPFEQDLHEELREQGIGPTVELSEIRRQAATLVQASVLERAAPARLRLPAFSEVVRYNRAEGLALNAGFALTPAPRTRVGLQGGYAFGAAHPLGVADLTLGDAPVPLAAVYVNRPRDIGVGPVVSGAMNTLSSLFAAHDYQDLFYTSGAELALERRVAPAWAVHLGARAERQRSARDEVDFSLFGGDFRPVRAIDEADLMVGGTLALTRRSPAEAGRWWSTELVGAAGLLDPRGDHCVGSACPGDGRAAFARPHLTLAGGQRWGMRAAELTVAARAGAAVGDVPLQEMFLIGGRGTVPGYGFRAFGGDRYGILNATASADVASPWVRGRVLGALGWADLSDPLADRAAHFPGPTPGVLPSLGIGAGIFHDILQVDLARGLGSHGRWELIVEARRAFWDFL